MLTDITMQAAQSEIEDSILDAPIVAQLRGPSPFVETTAADDDEGNGPQQSIYSDTMKFFEEELEDQESGILAVMKFGDEAIEKRLAERGDKAPERLRSERPEVEERSETGGKQAQQSQTQEQAQPLTVEQVHAGIESLDRTVMQYGLNDPQTAKSFSDDFCAALGTDVYKSGIDVERFGSVMAKTALSAVGIYESTQGDVSNLAEVPAESARAFSHDLLTAFGIDPRSMQVNEQLLAQTALGGMLNFIDTYSRYGGKVTDLSVLNTPDAAELFFGNFLRALGHDRPVDRTSAVKFADACGKYVLGMMGKLRQIQGQQTETKRGSKGQRWQRIPVGLRSAIKGSRAPRFKTNQDYFDGPTMDYYQQQHGKL